MAEMKRRMVPSVGSGADGKEVHTRLAGVQTGTVTLGDISYTHAYAMPRYAPKYVLNTSPRGMRAESTPAKTHVVGTRGDVHGHVPTAGRAFRI